jgi:hypothetical protein
MDLSTLRSSCIARKHSPGADQCPGSRLRTPGVPPPCRGLTGIVTGDSIIAVEGRPVNKAADLSNILDDFKIGAQGHCMMRTAAWCQLQRHIAAQPATAAARHMWHCKWLWLACRGQSHAPSAAWRQQPGRFKVQW